MTRTVTVNLVDSELAAIGALVLIDKAQRELEVECLESDLPE